MAALIARYRGACTECPEPITPGQPIERLEDGPDITYRHQSCPDDPDTTADRQALAQPRCGTCGLHHPGDC